MMSSIKIVEVNAKNFLSYKELKYIVPNKGIVMIEGVNTDSREYSDSNGAGKSTLFDAIYWALFEKWTRRSQYRAGRVVNDAVGKDCSVAVGLDVDGSSYGVVRYSKDTNYGNNLFLYAQGDEGKIHDLKMTIPETQQRINNLLGISWEVFFNTVMFGGGRFKSFIEAQDSEKKQIYEDMLGVSVFSRARDIVKGDMQELQCQLKDLEDKKSSALRNIQEMENNLKEYAFKAQLYEEQMRKDKEQINISIEALEKALTQLENEKLAILTMLESEKSQLTALRKDKEDCEVLLANIKKDKEVLDGVWSDLTGKVSRCTSEISSLKAYITKFKEIGPICPTCERAVKPGEFDYKLVEAQKRMDVVVSANSDYSSEITKNRSMIKDKIQPKMQEIDDRIRSLIRDIGKFDTLVNSTRITQLNNVDLSYKSNVKNRDELRSRLDNLSAAANPWYEVIDKINKSLEESKHVVSNLDTEMNSYMVLKPIMEFWDEGFSPRGMESFLFETVLPELNEKMREYTEVLFAGNVAVRVMPTSRLKKGDLREKISFEVDGLSLDTASDGELRRLDIAMLLANNYLLRRRVDVNIMLFDQVFDVLDPTGCERVIDVLGKVGVENIFIISHNPELKSMFHNVWRVVKENGESRLQI